MSNLYTAKKWISRLIVCAFLISSMTFIGMGLVANSSMTTTQHTLYLPSQENQTVFANYSYDSGDTTSSNPSISVRIDVVDQDGVEMVWFLYRRTNESQWSNNKSMVISPAYGENTFSGSFRVTLAPYTKKFDIQFFANDSLGHVAESVVYQLMAHYNPGNPTPGYLFITIEICNIHHHHSWSCSDHSEGQGPKIGRGWCS